jgi:hypothetical protein
MKTFCPNCEKETDCSFICEVYFCKECNEDNGNYEKPSTKHWKSQASTEAEYIFELSSFISHLMTLGLLRGSLRLTQQALDLLDKTRIL